MLAETDLLDRKAAGLHCAPRWPSARRVLPESFMLKVSQVLNLLEKFDRLPQPRILVLGDLMLDRYTWGRADRTSQEAPVVILQAEGHDHRLGGASNVAFMLRVLACDATCVGVVGDDEAGQVVQQLLQESQVDTQAIAVCSGRKTTLKERFVGRAGSGLPSQILRVDIETTAAIDGPTERALIDAIRSRMARHDAVLISDYAKGVCTPAVLRATIESARQHDVPVLVDPGRKQELALYRGATLIKPNRHETELATGRTIRHPSDALSAGAAMCEELELDMAVITLDADGMALIERGQPGHVFSTRARSVFDITGAGDMVLAMLGLCLGGGIDSASAVQLANVAAGLEVDRTGVTALTRGEIRRELHTHQLSSRRKLVTIDEMARLADEYRRRGKRIVMTNGCFDLLHVGHATYLEEAAGLGDILLVAINSDSSVRRLKGPQRPVIQGSERAAMLAALGCVDHVLEFEDDTPLAVVAAVKPDILVKGGNYLPHEIVGREIVESYGGRVCVASMVPGVSTSEIVQSVQKRAPLRKAG